MKKPPDATPGLTQEAAKLRRSAEAKLKTKTGHKESVPGIEEARRLLHELQVYQIELEIQNEELQQARSETEMALKNYADLYDFTPIGYCTLNRRGEIDRINLSAARLLGMERSKLTGVYFGKFVDDCDRFVFADFLARIFFGPGNIKCKLTLKCGRGARRTVHVEADTDVPVKTCRMTMLDITERQQAEEAIIQAADKIEDLYNHAPCGYHSVDKDGTIIKINDTELAWLGYARDEVIGKMKIQDLMPPASLENFKTDYPQFMKLGFVHDLEFEMIRKDGTIIPMEVNATAIYDNSGNYLMSRSTMFDITKRKQIEQKMKLNARKLGTLQKQQVALHTAAAFAHELNQPLLAIASYSKAIQIMLKAASPDQNKISTALAATEQQANRAGKSIRQLLELLSMDQFPVETFDLNREIIDVLNTARQEHELRFQSRFHLEDGLPLVQANRTHVQKVLLNLLHNSLEAMQQVGVPEPAIIVSVRTAKEERVAQVTIKDNGPGFDKETIQRMFEPFFTTKASGIGMGLVISRSLIETNGGQLWVDPHERPGATFHLTLPFAP